MDEDDKAFWERWRSNKWDSHVGAFCDKEMYSRNRQGAAIDLVAKLIASLSTNLSYDSLSVEKQAEIPIDNNQDITGLRKIANNILIIQLIVNDLLEGLNKDDFMRIFNVAATGFGLDATEIF